MELHFWSLFGELHWFCPYLRIVSSWFTQPERELAAGVGGCACDVAGFGGIKSSQFGADALTREM